MNHFLMFLAFAITLGYISWNIFEAKYQQQLSDHTPWAMERFCTEHGFTSWKSYISSPEMPAARPLVIGVPMLLAGSEIGYSCL